MAAYNTLYKALYTSSEVEKCFEWFVENKDRLPASMSLDGGVNIPHLSMTVERMMNHLRHRAKNPNYSGQFSLLLLIRDKLLHLEGFQENI